MSGYQLDLISTPERPPDGGEHAEGCYRFSLWRRVPADMVAGGVNERRLLWITIRRCRG